MPAVNAIKGIGHRTINAVWRIGVAVEHLLARQAGIRQVDGFDMFGKFFEQHAAQHGFAAADLAADLDDAFRLAERVDQRIQNFAAVGAGKEKYRDGRDPERGFAESEVL
ncbi:MAG: hypothetical protein A2143_11010 [Gallionellales bacterium RBG_16_57_15]|nr:MAG: hypothetical protein A2143_11010 [Gallionellales bacterium RBG_16_57_15]